MGGGGEKMPGRYMGWWGSLGIVTYSLSHNRQRPLAGTAHAAIFNTYRRTRGQILFWAVPMVAAYQIMTWAAEKNEHYNSKAGRAEHAGEE